MRAFVPQLQTTFVKALLDPTKQVEIIVRSVMSELLLTLRCCLSTGAFEVGARAGQIG